MRKLILVCLILALGAGARAQQAGRFGAGVILGDPTGLTAKYWLDDTRAVDFGVGFSGDAAFYGDFIWHGWNVFPQPQKGKLAAYLAAGPRIETEKRTALGIRTMAGAGYWVSGQPIEIFMEAGPVFRLDPDRDVDFDAGLGVRFYFGG